MDILHGLEKFHHYCFAREVSIITDHKPLLAIFKKDVATLSHRIQCILLRIHQYQVRIIHKPGPELFITDWLSRHNHTENKDEETHGMDVKVDTIDNNKHPRMQQIQQVMAQDEHLHQLKGQRLRTRYNEI